MSFLSRWRAWASATRGDARDADLDRELADWVAELAARHEAAGVPPADARRRALVETGGVEQVKEAVRAARTGGALDTCVRDARHAWRGLWKSPSFTLVVIATLALGIGATAAIFTVVNAMLIAPLPYRDSSSLVFVWADMTDAGYPRAPLSGPELGDLRERSTRFAGFGAVWATSAGLTGDGDPEQLRVGVVTPDFFQVLGVDAALGRTFVPEDEPQLLPERIILSSALWQRRYGSDPTIVGRRVRVMGQAMTVVGVLPADFRLLLPPDASVPDDLDAFMPYNRTLARAPRMQQFLRVVGRMRPGVTIDQAQAEIADIASRISRQFTEYGAAGRVMHAVPLQRDAVREIRAPLLTLFGGVALLLMIACLNVANLLMARVASRNKETALRIALGAGRLQLLRESLVEGLILASLGGAAGLLVAHWGLAALVSLRPDSLDRIASARIDPMVLMFTAGTSLVWGLLFSLPPLAMRLRTNVSALLRDARHTHGALQYRTRATLVIAQIGLGVTLLVGAALTARTFLMLQRVDPGFRSEGALSFRLTLPITRYRTPEAYDTFAQVLQEKLSALPGVRRVGAITHLPFDRIGNWAGAYTFKAGMPKSLSPLADYRAIDAGYFETVGARLVEGRFFTDADKPGAEPVAIVDDLLARRMWPGRSPIGQRFAVDPNSTGSTDRVVSVVGVVRHLRIHSLQEDVREQVYLPWRQVPWSPISYVVATSGDPAALTPAIRRAVAQVDAALAVYDVRPLVDYTSKARATQRFTMVLAATFAAVALLLACVGVYGVVAYAVAQRRHEFGVRLALGAQPNQLIRLVLNDGVKLTASGLIAGVVGGLLIARLLQNQLFGVSPHDALAYAIAVSVLGASAIAACLIPARRATESNALDVLRAE